MKRLKIISIAFVLVFSFSSIAFAVAPIVLAGYTLATALAGSTILAVLKPNSSYIVSRLENLKVGDILPGVNFVRINANVIWNNLTDPANPVVMSAPVTVNVPTAKVKEIVSQYPKSYPKLQAEFYSVPEVLPSDQNTMASRFVTGFRLDWNGVEYTTLSTVSTEYLLYPTDNPLVALNDYLTGVESSVASYLSPGGICSVTAPITFPVSDNPTNPSQGDLCVNSVMQSNTGKTVLVGYNTQHMPRYVSSVDIITTYRRYQVAVPQSKILSNTVSLDQSFNGELANMVVMAAPGVDIMDGSIPLSAGSLTGAGVETVPYAATGATAVPLVKADIIDAVKTAIDGEFELPGAGTYDTSIAAPATKSISNLLSSLFANSPLAGMVRTFTLSTSGQSAIVEVGDVYGKPFKFDFTRWQSYLVACGSMLLVIVHGFAILIVMRGWKNG